MGEFEIAVAVECCLSLAFDKSFQDNRAGATLVVGVGNG